MVVAGAVQAMRPPIHLRAVQVRRAPGQFSIEMASYETFSAVLGASGIGFVVRAEDGTERDRDPGRRADQGDPGRAMERKLSYGASA
jgi:hypothetical protein